MSANKNQIIKIALLTALLVVVGFLVYNNFIKDKSSYPAAENSNLKSEAAEFGFDFFENEVFKSLIKAEQVKLPTSSELGRENPFLKF